MEIKISQKDYKNLLRALAITNHIYGTMSNLVSSKYEKDIDQYETLTNKILSYNDNLDVEVKYRGKKEFSDIYMDEMMADFMEYEEFSFWSLLTEKMADKIVSEKINSMDTTKTINKREFIYETCEIERILENDFIENELKNIIYAGKL